ncbi:MAG: sel1 repeat family protein [Akkermansia sp.]|nr:sel1 repeat family protein [Akkermansia sp.]
MKLTHRIACAFFAAALTCMSAAAQEATTDGGSVAPATLPETSAPAADMSFEALEKAAAAGDAEAQAQLAECYFTGRGTAADPMLGIQQLSYAVGQNNAKAQTMLGACYYSGTGLAVDYVTALEWFNRAALAGYPQAYMCLYAAYRDGNGVPADSKIALQWLEKAVSAKHPDAMCEMALLKLKGELGEPVNIEAAHAVLEEARSLGSSQAEKMLKLLDEASAK